MIYIFVLFEIISVVIYAIMSMCDGFQMIIPGYKDYDSEKPMGMGLMAFVGGWLFAPYFIYLAYKWYKINQNK